MKSMRPIFKTEMLIYQSKANFDEIILYVKIACHSDPAIRKMLERETRIPHSFLVHNLLTIEFKCYF